MFRALIPQLARARFWAANGVEAGMAYADFQKRVALRGPEQLAPAIERMQQGEADVLWPGRCVLYASTAGTTTGKPAAVPVTDEFLAHLRRAGGAALLYYAVRAKHAGVFRGRHLLLGSSNTLAPAPAAGNGGARIGDLSGIATLNLPAWVERDLYEPGAAVAQIADWTARLDATVARTRTRDISMAAGTPCALLALASALQQKNVAENRAAGSLRDVWPNLECLVHTGAPLAPYYEELRALAGTAVKFHEVYAASEGFIATQDGEPLAGLRLMADAGMFFEFLPHAEFDEARLELLGSKAIPLADVKPGVNYVLLLTTPAGLVRYVLGDVVRFVSTRPPRLVYVGRTRLQLGPFGERVSERDLTDALVAICQRAHWTIVNFHVAPLFAPSFTGQNRGRHEWWVELKPGTVVTPTGPQMALQLDAELQRLSPDYAARRKTSALDQPFVRLVMPGVFEHWLRYHQQWGDQHKMPRCRSDRLVADELAQITNFARD